MAKTEIGWKDEDADGEKRQVNAKLRGGVWAFTIRGKRFDNWEVLKLPTLLDWQNLLEGVRRRLPRGLYTPDEEKRIIRKMRELFPDEEIK
ncbi:hypothetical protein N9059_01230 [bacterium]|nr:hypothetical protein [bacterium]